MGEAVRALIRETPFGGALANSWEAEEWAPTDYMRPDPGSVGAAKDAAGARAHATPSTSTRRVQYTRAGSGPRGLVTDMRIP